MVCVVGFVALKINDVFPRVAMRPLLGDTLVDRVTAPWNPFCALTVTVADPVDPLAENVGKLFTVDGLTETAKSGASVTEKGSQVLLCAR